MKRTREDGGSGESPYAIQFEIMHGLTRANSEAYLKTAYSGHARLVSSNPETKYGVDVATLYNNVSLPWMAGQDKVLAALWPGGPAGGSVGTHSSPSRPAFVRTVQLVANDATTLIFADGSATVTVSREAGEQIFPGDVVLVSHPSSSSPPGPSLASAAFCAIDASVFDDAESWRDAVSSNILAAVRWACALTAQPPGLPQLTFIQACCLGAGTDGWARVLQLPLLMEVKKKLRDSLDRATADKLRRATLSLLSTLLSVFRHSQSIIDLGGLYRGLLLRFLSSPIFMEGLSTVLPQCADHLGSTAWRGAAECLAAGVELAVAYACEPVAERDLGSGPPSLAAQEAARAALGSFEAVLHRLSGVWLGYTKRIREMRRHGQDEAPEALSRERRVHDMLEQLAAEHTFRPVAQWLQQREVSEGSKRAEQQQQQGGGGGGGTDLTAGLTPLDRIQQPPTLAQVEALTTTSSSTEASYSGGNIGGSILRATVVTEQLEIMSKTYSPYLGKDVLRFVEAAAIAAHSELYGPASRALRELLRRSAEATAMAEARRAEEDEEDGGEDGGGQRRRQQRRRDYDDDGHDDDDFPDPTPEERIRVTGTAAQCGLASGGGGFDRYSFAEVRHMAEYGLPLRIPLSAEGIAAARGESDGGSGVIAALQAAVARNHGGSCFAFLLIRLQGQSAVFPVVVTHVSAEGEATAYVMREADLLPQMLQLAAALAEDGLPDVWLLTGHDDCDAEAEAFHAPSCPPMWQRSAGSVHEVMGGGQPRTRVLPDGAPALTYIDLLTRLNVMRVELREELSSGVDKGSSGRAAAAGSNTSPTSPNGGGSAAAYMAAAAPRSSLCMWLRYFARGVSPAQSGAQSLSASASGIVTGTGGAGKEITAALMREATDATGALTPAQTEALYALASGAVAHGGASGGALGSLRIVEGSVGSGKTSMLYAAGAVKGRVLAAARKEHQASLNPALRESTAHVKKCQARAAGTASLSDLLPDDAAVSVVEDLPTAVEDQLREYSRLGRGAHYCSTPLLIRCGRLGGSSGGGGDGGGMPAATRELLLLSGSNSGASPAMCDVTEVLGEALARSRKAPLAIQLAQALDHLGALGETLSRFVDSGDGAALLDSGILSLIMSARETQETMAATATTASANWPEYLRTQLWKAVAGSSGGSSSGSGSGSGSDSAEDGAAAVVAGALSRVAAAQDESSGGGEWITQMPMPSGRLGVLPVQMPETTHLPNMTADQAAGWHAVYLEKQGQVLPLLLNHLHAAVRGLFRLFLDIVAGVASAAQVDRFDLITCSEAGLLSSLALPFLWRWSPSHVIVDDFAVMRDGLLLALCPANTLTLSLSAEVPLYVERHLHGASMSILRALRKDLQRTAALTTTALHEPMRCGKPEINAALGQMCVGGDSAPFSSLIQMAALDDNDEDGEGGDNNNAAPSTQPCFPGFSSFSSLELWTHAVPVMAGGLADRAAARFIAENILKYKKVPGSESESGSPAGGSNGLTRAERKIQVCFPFAGEAREFAREVAASGSLADEVSSAVFPFSGVVDPFDSLQPASGDSSSTTAGSFGDTDETDLVILCLSALSPTQFQRGGYRERRQRGGGAQSAHDSRAAVWKSLLSVSAAKPGEAGAAGSPGSASDSNGTSNGTNGGGVGSSAVSSTNASMFLERLQWWLWRTIARGREGLIVLCSKEFALHVPMFQYFEKYVMQLRRLLCPTRRLGYWLPKDVACTVLALSCPDHYRCRRTATIAFTEETTTGRESRAACEPVIRGAVACRSLCLKCFDGCTSRSHACLHTCHIATSGREDATHSHCPYPCGKPLGCGHVCDKDCGSACEPCTFVGLTELTCGQRIVCGTNTADKTVQYELVHHFQESRCGVAVRPCPVPVTVRCPRCGTKAQIPCFQQTAHESRAIQAQKDERNHQKNEGYHDAATAAAVDPASAVDYILSEGECPGCVAVYNRVSAKFGFELVPEPTIVARLNAEGPSPGATAITTATGDDDDGEDGARVQDSEENLCAMRTRAGLPRRELSADAQTELRKAFTVAAKRSELLVMKEALEVSNGSASDKSDYVTRRREYDEHRATQQRQLKGRQDALSAEVGSWVQRLRAEYGKQSELTAELEAMMPSLRSEALEEASRQQRY